MTDVQIAAHLCEDYRIEMGDKPMLLGIYAPVIYSDTESDDLATFWLAIFVTAKKGTDTVRLEVHLTESPQDGEETVNYYRKVFDRDGQKGNWGFFIPLPISNALKFGTEISVKVTANDATFDLSMACESTEVENGVETEPNLN